MKRRVFISLSTVGVALLGVPWITGCNQNNDLHEALSQPGILGHLCDEKGILEIGKKYIKQVPEEASLDQLIQLLLTTDGTTLPRSSERTAIQSLLDKKIEEDFQANRTRVVNGWVLSVTEARQCAVYSLIQ
ncbi:MAG TPA: hypothetical protein VGK59_14865 [Ohtaekwangia sp.]